MSLPKMRDIRDGSEGIKNKTSFRLYRTQQPKEWSSMPAVRGGKAASWTTEQTLGKSKKTWEGQIQDLLNKGIMGNEE